MALNMRSVMQPSVAYKDVKNVKIQAVPVWSRPVQYNNADANIRKARPIKHWRKQLNPVKNSGSSNAGVGMPSDIPGGMVSIGCTGTAPGCKNIKKLCPCGPDPNGVALSQHVLNTGDCDCHITRSANTRISLSNKYYSSTQGYLYAKCRTYDQNLGKPNVPESAAHPNTYVSLTCPSGACGSSNAKPTVIYKPNNAQFKIQGAATSGDRITRLRLNTVEKNKASLKNHWISPESKKYYTNTENCNAALPVQMRGCR